MCTFCGRGCKREETTKVISVYGKNDTLLGSFTVPIGRSVREYQRGLYIRYPEWRYTKSK